MQKSNNEYRFPALSGAGLFKESARHMKKLSFFLKEYKEILLMITGVLLIIAGLLAAKEMMFYAGIVTLFLPLFLNIE